MSQDQQVTTDRTEAEDDCDISAKPEFESLSLHEKVDYLRQKQEEELLALQNERLDLLSSRLAKERPVP